MLHQVLQICKRQGSKPAVHRITLIVLTFIVFAPMVCHRLLYSYFYDSVQHLDLMTEEYLKQNLDEAQAAVTYFKERVPSMNAKVTPSVLRDEVVKPWLVITIITVQRKPEYHYLMQVASRIHSLLEQCGVECSSNQIFICNVDQNPSSHKDAIKLKDFFHTTERNKTGHKKVDKNSFEKEKQDYVYCLEETLLTFDSKYVLLLEDDAVPEEDFFSVINHLLHIRFPEKPLGGALYFKLFHPERLQHYLNPEPMRILEWIGLGMFFGNFISLLYGQVTRQSIIRWSTFFFFAVYSMVLAEMVGRHYILELRRLSPSLYNVVPVTECCTQAMLYSASSARRVIEYLSKIYCRTGFAKDIALYSVIRQTEEWAFVVEPNLVRHIGLFSSLPSRATNPKLL